MIKRSLIAISSAVIFALVSYSRSLAYLAWPFSTRAYKENFARQREDTNLVYRQLAHAISHNSGTAFFYAMNVAFTVVMFTLTGRRVESEWAQRMAGQDVQINALQRSLREERRRHQDLDRHRQAYQNLINNLQQAQQAQHHEPAIATQADVVPEEPPAPPQTQTLTAKNKLKKRLAKIKFNEDDIDEEFLDPLTLEIMEDPLKCHYDCADNGKDYKKAVYICDRKSYNDLKRKCPYTHKEFDNVKPHNKLRERIIAFVEAEEAKAKPKPAEETAQTVEEATQANENQPENHSPLLRSRSTKLK